jgi:hypothetical protein
MSTYGLIGQVFSIIESVLGNLEDLKGQDVMSCPLLLLFLPKLSVCVDPGVN